ncbi:MAG: glycosyltransferase family 2 protein [Patescibacteria group bacterium]|jgi:glycosyltransferase involved in cell wall biosynthesis
MKHISVVILAKNEEKNIADAIDSARFADEIIVLDDFSTDKTAAIARKQNAKVIQYKGKNDFAERRNFAAKLTQNDWILYLDADERVSKELANEIIDLPEDKVAIDYALKRIDFFWNHEIRFGEVYHARFVRLVHRKSGSFMRPVHEVWKSANTIQKLASPLFHYPHQTIGEFLNKINTYSTLNARYFFDSGKQTSALDIVVTPIGKFLYTYLLRRGFLDGPAGFVYSFMMSFHSFLTRSKLYLLSNDHNH